MDLDNPIEIIVHHLMIRRMTYLGCRDGFPMVSALVYVMHIGQNLRWIVMQEYQVLWFTKFLYYMDSQLWENIESMSKPIRGFDL